MSNQEDDGNSSSTQRRRNNAILNFFMGDVLLHTPNGNMHKKRRSVKNVHTLHTMMFFYLKKKI